VRVERDSVFLVIEDDGRGFDVESTTLPGTRRLGLPGIAERVALLGGASSVESAPGRGTALLVRIPRWNAATA
jgi:signal transduction histidine kinase